MIANPLVRFLERRVKLVRRHSSIVIVAAALALVIGLLYLLVSRTFVLLRQFIIDLPGLYAGIEGDVELEILPGEGEELDETTQIVAAPSEGLTEGMAVTAMAQ